MIVVSKRVIMYKLSIDVDAAVGATTRREGKDDGSGVVLWMLNLTSPGLEAVIFERIW
jgi:hypothetical protein